VNRLEPGAGMADIVHPALQLASHGYAVAIDPVRGGRIISATYEGLDVLRPDAGSGAASALDSACFPLVPFSNRIRNGAFAFQGQYYQLGKNWDGDAHAINGEGWLRPWDVVAADGSRALLRLRGTGWWPWAYECLQEITVIERGIGLALTLRNIDASPVPAGLDLHPDALYTDQTMLRFDATSASPPLGQGLLVSQPLGSRYKIWEPTSGIGDRARSLLCGLARDCYDHPAGDRPAGFGDLAPGGAQHCVVYKPADAPYFCVEPVSHLTGAFEAAGPAAAGLEIFAAWRNIGPRHFH
jgi:aldose 1-epimerase